MIDDRLLVSVDPSCQSLIARVRQGCLL